MSENGNSTVKHLPGQAHIKEEYLVEKDPHVHAKETNVEENKNDEESTQSTEEQTGEPPKKKQRGQNKNRPRNKQMDFGDRLCPSLVSSKGTCTFKGGCKFIHDIKSYVENKPKDIGETCYAFHTYGYCPYGLSCRFGRSHIEAKDDIYESIECSKKMNEIKPPIMQNQLNHQARIKLRKNIVQYSKSTDILKEMNIDDKYSKKSKKFEFITCKKLGEINKELNNPDNESNIGCTIPNEKKKIDFSNKVMLAPLTTCGNLPFRVICKRFGADITCGEMAMATALLQGSTSEWALVKRHPCEDIYGVQLCGAFADTMVKCTELLNEVCDVDFIDINMGCPIDLVYKKGGGSALMRRQNKLEQIVKAMVSVSNVPITCKMRTGVEKNRNTAHNILSSLKNTGIEMAAVHGRSREARYTKVADWDYIGNCAKAAETVPLYGNGDIFSYDDYCDAIKTGASGVMIARGALIKPWIFTEIKEKKVWDISSTERFDIMQNYVNEGLMYWGSDTKGVETTRRFLLEWLSFLYRYIPVGILEQPQKINERPPYFVGRNDLETLLASPNCNDWVKISEMFLGKVPIDFQFLPKHKANAYN